MSASFYTPEELVSLGLRSVGTNVLISRKASFYGNENISIGNNVRIDDFCILSGNITIGNNIHISAYVALYGSAGIVLEDYSGLSPRSTVYSEMDDFSGEALIGPVHDVSKRNVHGGEVVIRRYSQIGCNSVIFPDVTIEEGVAVGAMSLVKTSLDPWGIYAGIPVRRIGDRSRKLIELQ